MESIKIINYQGIKLQVIYQRQGNDKDGSPLYIINIFRDNINVNWKSDKKKDKYNNIKIRSYNINADIQYICDSIDF